MFATITIPACSGCCTPEHCGLTGPTVDLVLAGVTICACHQSGEGSIAFGNITGLNTAHSLDPINPSQYSISGAGSFDYIIYNTPDCTEGSVIGSGSGTFSFSVDCVEGEEGTELSIGGFADTDAFNLPIFGSITQLDVPGDNQYEIGDCAFTAAGYDGTATASNPA